MPSLPYLAAPTNIPKALDKIRDVPTPPRITQDFVKTKLQIPSSSGNQMTSYLKRIGLANTDGTPTDLYLKARSRSSAGRAIRDALKIGYSDLYEHNEYAHDLEEEELRDLIIRVTGAASDARSVDLVSKCFNYLRERAVFEGNEESEDTPNSAPEELSPSPASIAIPHHIRAEKGERRKRLGMNLSYTINLNLPPSTDIAVFNAIFKSLKENLLKDIDEHEG